MKSQVLRKSKIQVINKRSATSVE